MKKCLGEEWNESLFLNTQEFKNGIPRLTECPIEWLNNVNRIVLDSVFKESEMFRERLAFLYGVKNYRRPGTKRADSLMLLWFIKQKDPYVYVPLDTMADFLSRMHTGELRQSRHAGLQDGYCILQSRQVKLYYNQDIPEGSLWFASTDVPHPGFSSDRRQQHTKYFSLSEVCQTCGGIAGERHRGFKTRIGYISPFHADPQKENVEGNLIDQCNICNEVFKDDYVFFARNESHTALQEKWIERSGFRFPVKEVR